MNLLDIQRFIDANQIDKLKSILDATKIAYFIGESLNAVGVPGASDFCTKDRDQYNPKKHDIFNPAKRTDKNINDDEGNVKRIVAVSRLGIAEQKNITLLASSFLGVPELESTPKPGVEEDMLRSIKDILEENKYSYKFKEILKRCMSERECAELWYTLPAENGYWNNTPLAGVSFKLKLKVLSPSMGDALYPVYDEYGDMIAFCRAYETIVKEAIAADKKVYHFDIYTANKFYYAVKTDSTWAFENGDGTSNPLGKIPVIYYSQPTTEWNDVQEMIDRLEKKISNHADTNDYFDSPIIFAEGDVTGFAEKGETGKLLIGKNQAKVSYLTWDQAPESTKMEIENLLQFIKTYSHTPNISFENVKGLGQFSGIALKFFFMDAHLKAADNEAIYGQGVQRSINYLKFVCGKLQATLNQAIRLSIKPKFTYFLPKNDVEQIDNIVKCKNAGILSLRTAVKLNPLVEDYLAEIELINAEKIEREEKESAKLAAQSKFNVGVGVN